MGGLSWLWNDHTHFGQTICAIGISRVGKSSSKLWSKLYGQILRTLQKLHNSSISFQSSGLGWLYDGNYKLVAHWRLGYVFSAVIKLWIAYVHISEVGLELHSISSCTASSGFECEDCKLVLGPVRACQRPQHGRTANINPIKGGNHIAFFDIPQQSVTRIDQLHDWTRSHKILNYRLYQPKAHRRRESFSERCPWKQHSHPHLLPRLVWCRALVITWCRLRVVAWHLCWMNVLFQLTTYECKSELAGTYTSEQIRK